MSIKWNGVPSRPPCLPEEENLSIERTQKTTLRIILKEQLNDKRKHLCLSFARKCLKGKLTVDLFWLNLKLVNTRPHEKFYVTPARTERLACSTVPYLQLLLTAQQL